MESQPAVTKPELRPGKQRCRIEIGAALLARTGELIPEILIGPHCAIISDSTVAQLFADRLKQSLTSSGFQMIAAGLDRQSFVIGLGGGMVGDISGFVAAIYERGIPHVQIPTTLLAMVDSSIGGKTGVNASAGKNLIGAFHHPSLVIDDVDLLKTLPRREFNQGFAEIIKHAIIADAEMFTALRHVDLSNLAPLIRRNIEIKSRIVAKDELDQTGERALLNFGHTVGHAIERAGDYREFLHGEAVSLGIVAACVISIKKAGLPKDQRDAITDLLRAFELPARLPANFPREKILDALQFDKKFQGRKVRFVVTPAIGSARLSSDATMEDIREAIDQL